jgi:(p)ppGpp synthase/HD superfamily hydrolase
MELTERQQQLFEFIKEKHRGQKRKYSDEPYYTHLLRVAEMVSQYSCTFNEVEIALCHDVIEDTDCTLPLLAQKLKEIGYNDTQYLLKGVKDLTDVYTKKAFPQLNRKERKLLESKRLKSIAPYAQTVKYADIIDNTNSIAEEAPDFARVYLKEIEAYIGNLKNGNAELYAECCKTIKEGLRKVR